MEKLFDWFKGDEKTSPDISPDSGVSPTSGLRVETTESAKVISETSRGRSKKPDTGKRTFSLEEPDTASDAAKAQIETLEAILDPKVWRGVVAAPGDMMVAIGRGEHWELSDEERDTLAKTGAATARCFAITDPKWLALTLFSFSILSIYGGRLVKDFKVKHAVTPAHPENVS